MRHLLTAAALSVALTTAAAGADKIPVPQPEREMGVSARPAIACYGEASAGKNITATRISDAFDGPVTLSADGLQIGLGAGCDVRMVHESGMGAFVGALGRYDWLDVSTGFGGAKLSADHMWSIAGRTGVSINPGARGYGLLGRSGITLGYPDIKTDRQGWLYGAGIELDIGGSPLTLFAEWNHVQWDKLDVSGIKLRPDSDVFRAGGRIYFGGK